MILTKKVEVCIVPSNIKYYKNIGIDVKLMQKIIIDIEFLSKQSNVRVDVSCDRCGEQRNIKFQSYYFNINRSLDKKTYMCDKCSHEKIKQTNRKKYGVDYFSQTDEFTERIKNTSLERFGEVHYSKTSDYIKKRTITNLSKFGVENPFQLTDLIKSSMKFKYGVEHPSQIETNKQSKQKNRRKTKEKNGDWIKLEDLNEWNLYKNRVRSLTSKNKKELFNSWDGIDYYDGEYIQNYSELNHNNPCYPTIDHKVSIYYGFINGINEEVISDLSNLVITKRIINIKKGKKSFIDSEKN